MLAIAPHKRGAIFLSAVDGNANRIQNSLKTKGDGIRRVCGQWLV